MSADSFRCIQAAPVGVAVSVQIPLSGQDLCVLCCGTFFSQCLTGTLVISPLSCKERLVRVKIFPFGRIGRPLRVLYFIAHIVFFSVKAVIAGCKELIAWILTVSCLKSIVNPFLAYPCFIQRRLPQDNRRMITIPADHLSCIADRAVIESLGIRKVLPARLTFDYQNAHLVTGCKERRILRVMSSSYGIETALLKQKGIPILHGIGSCITHIQISLMTICASQIQPFAINIETITLIINRTDTNSRSHRIHGFSILINRCLQIIKIRMFRMPQLRLFHSHLHFDLAVCPCFQRDWLALYTGCHLAILVFQLLLYHYPGVRILLIDHLGIHTNGCPFLRYLRIGDKNTAACHGICLQCIRDINLIRHSQSHVPVNSAIIMEIQVCLRSSRRCVRVILRGYSYRQHVCLAKLHFIGDIHAEAHVSTISGINLLTVQINIRINHHTFKINVDFFPRILFTQGKISAVPADSFVSSGTAVAVFFLQPHGVRNRYICKSRIIKILCLCSLQVTTVKSPV